MLRLRIVTAVLLVLAFTSSILFANHEVVRFIFAGLLGISLFELSKLTLQSGLLVSLLSGLSASISLVWFSIDIAVETIFYLVIFAVLLWLVIAIWLLNYHSPPVSQWISRRLIYFGLGLFLLFTCAITLIFIHAHFEQGSWILLYLMTLVWIADIAAYFSGRHFGKSKLAPEISPGKTWEGVIGGIVTNVVWMLLIYVLLDLPDISLFWFLGIGLATSILSVVGDLFESSLKRDVGVKDSGWLLPGHGGVLDRFDSMIAATPIFTVGLFLVGWV